MEQAEVILAIPSAVFQETVCCQGNSANPSPSLRRARQQARAPDPHSLEDERLWWDLLVHS